MAMDYMAVDKRVIWMEEQLEKLLVDLLETPPKLMHPVVPLQHEFFW